MAEFKINRLKYTWRGDWSSGDIYYPDDIVSFGGKVYVCLVEHNSESGGGFYGDLAATVPGTVPPEPAPRWEQMLDGYAWTGDWQANIPYSENDLVKYGGIVYRCNTQHTSDSLVGVDSTLLASYGLENDQASWTIIAKTEDWKIDWTPNQPYRINDIVKYGGVIYRCILAHISQPSITLGLEPDIAKWEIVHIGVEYRSTWQTGTRYRLYDIVKYGARAWICTAHHTASVFDETKFTVYAPGLEYENNWDTAASYQPGDVVKYGGYSYTALAFNQNSAPSTNPGNWELLSIGYNFRNDFNIVTSYRKGDVVRAGGNLYACILDSTGNVTTNTTYWETVTTSYRWRSEWVDSTNYLIGDLVTFELFAYECVQAHTSTSLLRPDLSSSISYWKLYSQGDTLNRLRTQGDINTYGITEDGSTIASTRYPIGSIGQNLQAISDLVQWDTFAEITKVYYVALDGVDDAQSGSTVDTPWRTVKYACEHVVGPATIFIKTGFYEEILPISIPAEVALVGDELRSVSIGPAPGYEQEDMFYVRNASGIRNMTLTGLTGTLGPLNQYLTRRPSAGAYVSLDPGSGTNDNTVWITSRSPYVQNVTTFGTGCVGLKVDGNLHNGGNRSIVANDFTQVLSDGIGAWVTNLGRSELVSVFSYYGHIGYLAENGGKIRATNGNSSYGTFGCVAEGVSLAEIPIIGNINNRTTEAVVESAFSDQAGDQILILEYRHCGQDYSSANYTFVGAGTGAAATPDIRTGGVSEVRIYTPGDSSSPGGLGYLNVINNAQTGDNLTITLAGNDPNLASDYLGMRVVIVSGTGSGQYGYIYAYDDVTKIATIYKESNDLPGWDHVAAFSIEPVLDPSTRYSIEPRVTFSAPPSGTRAQGRVVVEGNRITLVKIWDCGTGYVTAPTVTLTDPNNTADAVLQARINNGVLGPVNWVSRGNNYQTTSTRVTITGSGFADKYQLGGTIEVSNLTALPSPGDNLTIAGINDVVYRVVSITPSNFSAPYNASLGLFPTIGIEDSPVHNTPITIRQNYSQVRLTGHDFLDIGTGNFTSTDYPLLYKSYNFVPAPENEVVESGGGRVFYTSTDQDGNFRVGELFKVEQSTGSVTISAALFELGGLEELSLGGVSVGGTSVVVREFSTDATFTADSNNIVPTQKAVKAYLTNRISGGGANAFTTILTAGTVIVGPNLISTTTADAVNVDEKMKFNAPFDGYGLAMAYFANSWESDLM